MKRKVILFGLVIVLLLSQGLCLNAQKEEDGVRTIWIIVNNGNEFYGLDTEVQVGYICGLVDMWSWRTFVEHPEFYDQTIWPKIQNMSSSQILRIFIKYLENNPVELNRPTPELFHKAMDEALDIETYIEGRSVILNAENYVRTTGIADGIGLNSGDLTKYAKLRFKNNFSYIDYIEEDILDNCILLPEIEQKKIGSLFITVWTVGEDYPIAYHVECKVGSCFTSFWKDACLGYGAKENVPDSIKNIINEFIDLLAIDSFTAKEDL